MRKNLTHRTKAVLWSSGLSLVAAPLLALLLTTGYQIVRAPDVHPSMCTGHSIIVTSFTRDIRC